MPSDEKILERATTAIAISLPITDWLLIFGLLVFAAEKGAGLDEKRLAKVIHTEMAKILWPKKEADA